MACTGSGKSSRRCSRRHEWLRYSYSREEFLPPTDNLLQKTCCHVPAQRARDSVGAPRDLFPPNRFGQGAPPHMPRAAACGSFEGEGGVCMTALSVWTSKQVATSLSIILYITLGFFDGVRFLSHCDSGLRSLRNARKKAPRLDRGRSSRERKW